MSNPNVSGLIPSGTRDVLPDEMAELRSLTRAMIDLVVEAGYGEVRTPALEYEAYSSASQLGPKPAYRLIDEHGDNLVLRSDMTLPIARMSAARFTAEDWPLKFAYLAPTWRRVKAHRGEATEILQFGVELIGASASTSAVELIGLAGQVLDAAGLKDWRIAVGHADISTELLERFSVDPSVRGKALAALEDGDLVSLRALVAGVSGDLCGSSLEKLLTLRQPATSMDESLGGDGTKAIAELMSTIEALPGEVQERTIADFSLRPRMAYYGGIVFEIYDPAVGRPLGSGGRYDELFGSMGTDSSAIGFGLDVEMVHAAIAGEERGEGLGQ